MKYLIVIISTPPHLVFTHPLFLLHTGGCEKEGKPINEAEVYNFSDKKWTTLPPMPRNRAACTKAIVRDNKIYLVGGVTDKQATVPEVDCFDIDSKKWSQIAPLPKGVVGPYVALVDDKIYVLAGTDKKGCNQSVAYDFDREVWLALPDKPTPCYSCGGYVHERKVYIVGGRDGKKPVQAMEVFDLDTQQWEELTPMVSVRVFYNVVGFKDEIYVVGGLVPLVGVCKIVEKYSIHDDMWSRVKDMQEIRSDAGYGIVGGRLVVAGGLGGEKLRPMNTSEGFRYQGKRFHSLPPLVKERSSMTSLMFDGRLAVMNGVGEGGVQAIVEVLSKK